MTPIKSIVCGLIIAGCAWVQAGLMAQSRISGDGVPLVSAGSRLKSALTDLGATVTGEEIRIDLSADVLFDFDRSDIKTAAEPTLWKVVTVLDSYRGSKVRIEGHTDSKGTDAYNQTLSEQRAASIKRWLVSYARVDEAAIEARGWGETRPLVPNAKPDGSDDPDGRAKNRRVEIVVRKG